MELLETYTEHVFISLDGKTCKRESYKIHNRTLKEIIQEEKDYGKNGAGYYATKGFRGGFIHRLVVEADRKAKGLGPIPEGMQVDHIDGNIYNNDISNLRVVTPYENMQNPITRKNMIGAHVAWNRGKKGVQEYGDFWKSQVSKGLKAKYKGKTKHWLNKDGKTKHVFTEEIEDLIRDGWHLGRKQKS